MLTDAPSATVTRESGSASTLKEACEVLKTTALDSRQHLSARELLEQAARPRETEWVPGGSSLLRPEANERARLQAARALEQVAADADKRLASLLCRDILEQAITLERKREEEEAAAFAESARAVFRLADEDGSGALEFGELRTISTHSGEAQSILDRLDANRDGKISIDEWVGFFVDLHSSRPDIAMWLLDRSVHLVFERDYMMTCQALFHTFDKDGSGALDLHELMATFGDDELGKGFMQYCDANADQIVTLDEWMQFLMHMWLRSPALARHHNHFLMQRAAELKTMPAMAPPLRI